VMNSDCVTGLREGLSDGPADPPGRPRYENLASRHVWTLAGWHHTGPVEAGQNVRHD
jgi:hypothetical protein